MRQVDPRLQAAMIEQLARRREALAAGADHIGWKLAGEAPVVLFPDADRSER